MRAPRRVASGLGATVRAVLHGQEASPAVERVPDAAPDQRQRVDITGRVRSVTLRPRSQNVPAMHVELEVENGDCQVLTLVWLGRRRIPGIAPGVALRAHGLVTINKGRTTVFNPAYELLPVPTSKVLT